MWRALLTHRRRYLSNPCKTIQANGGMDAWRLSKLMGHASIANTTKYVQMSPEPLKDAWRGKR